MKARMRLARTPEDKSRWAARFTEHQDSQMQDRHVYYRMRELGASGQALVIIQDGSDQERYRVVRCLRQPKDLEAAGPVPRLKLLGSLAHGLAGVFFLIEEDVHKDSALTVEALFTTIEVAVQECLRRGVPVPSHAWIQMDNAPGENKNRFVFSALATLVARKIFASCTAAFLCQVCHVSMSASPMATEA